MAQIALLLDLAPPPYSSSDLWLYPPTGNNCVPFFCTSNDGKVQYRRTISSVEKSADELHSLNQEGKDLTSVRPPGKVVMPP